MTVERIAFLFALSFIFTNITNLSRIDSSSESEYAGPMLPSEGELRIQPSRACKAQGCMSFVLVLSRFFLYSNKRIFLS